MCPLVQWRRNHCSSILLSLHGVLRQPDDPHVWSSQLGRGCVGETVCFLRRHPAESSCGQPRSIRRMCAEKLRNTGGKVSQHLAGSVSSERGPSCLSAGPFSSSVEKHRERPGAPSAFQPLTKTLSAGLLRYVHCLPPQFCSSTGSSRFYTQIVPLFCFCRVFSFFFPARLAVFRPCQF